MLNALKLFILLTLSFSCNANDRVSDILSNHKRTLGNLSSWQQVRTITYQLSIKEPGFEVTGVYHATRSGKMRIDIFAEGKQVFSEAYNGTTGWQWTPDREVATLIKGEKADALRHGIELPGHLFTLLDMKQQGHSIEYVGSEFRGKTTADIILLTLNDGHKKYYFIDSKSGRIIANRDERAFHPDIDPTKIIIESRPSDYREVEGMNRSFRNDNHDLTNNKWLGTTKVLDIQVNLDVDEIYFEPSRTQALPVDHFIKTN